MPDVSFPERRASDADRERVGERLRGAAADGQLTMEELDERLHDAYTARTCGELEPLTADLQEASPARAAAPGGFSVRPGAGGARWLVAIMGGCDRRGRWRLGARCIALNLMGGSELDLTQVELAAERVELSVYSVMGGSEIRLPTGLNVEVSEFAFMGANSIDVGEASPSAGPALRLRLFSLMGGTDVQRGPKLTRAERRALKDRRREELGR